jgi:N-dimethylarginine dimethylaminohydrolase
MLTGKEVASPRLASPRAMLMCPPDAFDVAYAINAHMRDASGALRKPDLALARRQWESLRREYEAIGYAVERIEPLPSAPDMTFVANASYPFSRRRDEKAVVVSRMKHAERTMEPEAAAAFFEARGYAVKRLPDEAGSFEGAGDLVRAAGGACVFGGYGFRTSKAALQAVEALLEVPVVPLELKDERFYHLDTALVALDEGRALYAEAAFDDAGLNELRARIPRLLPAPAEEAAALFACNAHCPDGRNVLIDSACVETRKLLTREGFRVRPVDTSEFRKSGGSVFCLKAELP